MADPPLSFGATLMCEVLQRNPRRWLSSQNRQQPRRREASSERCQTGSELQGLLGWWFNKIPGKTRVKGHNFNTPGSLRKRDLFGLGVEGRVDQGNDKGRRSRQKTIVILFVSIMCLNADMCLAPCHGKCCETLGTV